MTQPSPLDRGPSSTPLWRTDDLVWCYRCKRVESVGAVLHDGAYTTENSRLIERAEDRKALGCCSACRGTGHTYDPSTGGRCWDCRGTGCAHPDPCGKGSGHE